MPKDYKQQIDDILQAINLLRDYIKDMDTQSFHNRQLILKDGLWKIKYFGLVFLSA